MAFMVLRPCAIFLRNYLFVETGSHLVVQVGLELTVEASLAWSAVCYPGWSATHSNPPVSSF